MASLSQCLCGQKPLFSPSPSAVLTSVRSVNGRVFRYASPIRTQNGGPLCHVSRPRCHVSRPLRPVNWWHEEDGLSNPKPPKQTWQKWNFFWCRRHGPSASIGDSENLPQDSSKAGNGLSRFNWKWIEKLQKVDISAAILGFPKKDEAWTVPWTGQTIFQVMFLWFFAFWLVGSWIMPFLAHAAGFNNDNMTYRGQALYSLLTDVAEGTVGLAILCRCLGRFHPLPKKWFHISWKGNWHIDTCLGCLMFPLVHRLSQINLDLLPVPSPFTASHVEQSILARDPVAMLLYAIVVSICAPIWEEVIFRGFLLPSLTRYMPIWSSILVSSIAFALAHFSVQRVLPLTFLGLVMGIVFVRSRNLLASMLLHSLWNGFVFLDLLR